MDAVHLQSIVDEINAFIETELWFDFEILEYREQKLIIIGSIDPSTHHNIEIFFDDVFFISSPVEWQTDTSKTALTIISREEAKEVNLRFQVEIGYIIFRFAPEYYPDDFGCLIAAKNISYRLP